MQQTPPSSEGSSGQSDNLSENVFHDLADTTGYDKNLRAARIWLYVMAGLQLIVGIYEYGSVESQTVGLIALAIDVCIGIVFFTLALWSRKKPVTAFVTALIFYIAVEMLILITEPQSIIKGLLIKILFILALIKAYKDARDNAAIRKAVG